MLDYEIYTPLILLADQPYTDIKDLENYDMGIRSETIVSSGRQQVRYNDLKRGEYEVHILYPNRPASKCDTFTSITFIPHVKQQQRKYSYLWNY